MRGLFVLGAFGGLLGVLTSAWSTTALRAEDLRQTDPIAGGEPTAGPGFFRFPRGDALALSTLQEQKLTAIKAEATATKIRPVRLNLGALSSEGAITLACFQRSFQAWKTETKKLDQTGRTYTWRGVVTAMQDFVSLDIEGDAVHGTIRSDAFHYQIEPLGGLHVIIKVKPVAEREHPPEFPSGAHIDSDQQASHASSHPQSKIGAKELFKPARQAAESPMLFKSDVVHPNLLDATWKKKLAAIEARKTTASVEVRKLDARSLSANTEKLLLNLGSGRMLTAFRTEVVGPDRPGGHYTWLGALALEANNTLNLVVNDSMCTGMLRYGDELFEIRPLGEDVHALIQLDSSKYPEEHPGIFPSGAEKDDAFGL